MGQLIRAAVSALPATSRLSAHQSRHSWPRANKGATVAAMYRSTPPVIVLNSLTIAIRRMNPSEGAYPDNGCGISHLHDNGHLGSRKISGYFV